MRVYRQMSTVNSFIVVKTYIQLACIIITIIIIIIIIIIATFLILAVVTCHINGLFPRSNPSENYPS